MHALDDLSPGMALLRESSRVLSRLAGTDSLIVAPRLDRRRLREICSDRMLLAALLFTDGTVESRMVDVQEVPGDAELERMHNLLAEAVGGKTLRQLRGKLASTLSEERMVLARLTERAYELGLSATDTPQDPVVMGGPTTGFFFGWRCGYNVGYDARLGSPTSPRTRDLARPASNTIPEWSDADSGVADIRPGMLDARHPTADIRPETSDKPTRRASDVSNRPRVHGDAESHSLREAGTELVATMPERVAAATSRSPR